jgi:hypothetical protein
MTTSGRLLLSSEGNGETVISLPEVQGTLNHRFGSVAWMSRLMQHCLEE